MGGKGGGGGKDDDKFDARFHAAMSASHTGREDGKRRRAHFLRVFKDTQSVKKSCEAIDVKVATYEAWRRRHPDFRQNVDAGGVVSIFS